MLVTRGPNGNLHSRAMAPANGVLESSLPLLSHLTSPSAWLFSVESRFPRQ